MLHMISGFWNLTKVAITSWSEIIGIFSLSMVSLMKVATPPLALLFVGIAVATLEDKCVRHCRRIYRCGLY